jgi:AcrR family transcriptional regulator
MPKRLFFDLTTHKQDTILDAAFLEFSRTDFDHSSINQIIKQANIARGSFYLYFEDKEDLVITLLKYVLTKQLDTYLQRFVPQKLKPAALYRQFIEFMFEVFDDVVYASFFKNIYLAMNYRIKKEFDDFALLFRQRLYDTIQTQSTLGFGQRNPPPIAIEIVSLLTRSLFEKKLAYGIANDVLLRHYDDVVSFLIKR